MAIREPRLPSPIWITTIIEFWRVPYDIAAVQKRMEKAGLPFPLVERIGAGR